MKKFILIMVAVASILGGCTNYKQIRIDDVKVGKLKMVALNAAEVELVTQVYNPTKAVFEIAGTDIIVTKDGASFAKITQVKRETVLIHPGEESKASVVLRAELTDPFAALSQGLNPKEWDLEKFKANGTVTVRKGKMYKKIKIEDVPLKELAQYMK